LATGGAQYPSNVHRTELLLDALSDHAIYMLDPSGFITSWNTGAERINGYSSIEIIGQHFSRLFTPEDRANAVPDKIVEVVRTTGRYEGEGWRVRKNGSRFFCTVTLQQVRDERGSLIGFGSITRDITDRRAAEQALLESERSFRLLVDSVIDYAIYMLDPSGIVVNWNAGAERLKGYTADEIIGQHFARFYTPEDRARGKPARVLEQAARAGRYEAEGWRVRKDGSRFWAAVVVDAIRDGSGELIGFAKVTRDITERRAAQDALRDSERQFRLLVTNITDYALFMIDPNGVITSWNAGAERIKGYTADEILGQHFSRFYTERDRAAGLPARALYTAAQEGRFETEGWRVRKNGEVFWANVVIDPIRDERGDLIGFAKMTRDITERRNQQIALQEAQAQRAQAQKMDALGQLTGGVAHDFNNLLMVVSGHIPTLKRKAGDDPRALRAAEAIEIAARRGASLTRQLLTFSRRQTFDAAVCLVSDRLDAFRTMLASIIGSSVKLVTTIGPEVWPIKVDRNELELAMVNLTLNARDAMPKGGVISISAENVVLSRHDTPEGIQGEFVGLHFADTGSGIAPDVLLKVFDPFFTTKKEGKGSGLGLSQVHGFAHQSRGTVTIKSELGRGTTVSLYLPRAHENIVNTEAERDEQVTGDGAVLVVEDNPAVAEATVSMLEQAGYNVDLATNAAEAIHAIDQKSFDLVVSDIVMAGEMDGVALARAIRERKPQLPVLLVTGFSPTIADPDFPLVSKPVQAADLSRTAARIIAESRQPPTANVVRLRKPLAKSPSKPND
jgi:PAS domain S-box-containing protein